MAVNVGHSREPRVMRDVDWYPQNLVCHNKPGVMVDLSDTRQAVKRNYVLRWPGHKFQTDIALELERGTHPLLFPVDSRLLSNAMPLLSMFWQALKLSGTGCTSFEVSLPAKRSKKLLIVETQSVHPSGGFLARILRR